MPYTGHLTDPAGQPVADGQYDFVFTLYASEKDDQAVWSETQLGVSVKGGDVRTSLGALAPFPAIVSKTKARTGWRLVCVGQARQSSHCSIRASVGARYQSHLILSLR